MNEENSIEEKMELLQKWFDEIKWEIEDKYNGKLNSDFPLKKHLSNAYLDWDFNPKMEAPASSDGNNIQFKEFRKTKEKNELLLFHEILHVLFTNHWWHKFIAEWGLKKYGTKVKFGIPKKLGDMFLDSFIDLQIKILRHFEEKVWSDLEKPKEIPYFEDYELRKWFNDFVNKRKINKELVNLENEIKEFLEIDNYKVLNKLVRSV